MFFFDADLTKEIDTSFKDGTLGGTQDLLALATLIDHSIHHATPYIINTIP